MTYPTTLPGLTTTNPIPADTLATAPHSTLHTDERIAIDALADKVGIDSSADTDSIVYKLSDLSGGEKAKSDADTVFGIDGPVTEPIAQVSDSTATGGNARGANAVDWQTDRAAADQVASSANSGVLWGKNNKSAANRGGIGGNSNTIAASNGDDVVFGGFNNSTAGTGGEHVIIGGENNAITGGANRATIIGSKNCSVTDGFQNGYYSTILGSAYALSQQPGQIVHGTNFQNVQGSAQKAETLYKAETVNNTQTTLDNGLLTGGGSFKLQTNSVASFKMVLVGRRSGTTGENSIWEVRGAIAKGAHYD